MNAAATATRINLSLLLLIVGLPLLIGLIVSLSGLTFQEPIGEILLWCLIPQIPTVIDLLLLGIARNVRKQSLCHTVQVSPEEMRRMNIQDL